MFPSCLSGQHGYMIHNHLGRPLLTCIALATAFPAVAQPAATTVQVQTPSTTDAERPTPYDERLSRLAEILGSIDYLRNLCSPAREDGWRGDMQQLLDTETKGEPKRKEKLTAAFNRGYRSFASVYANCTRQALVAEERYRNEGATLATEITARFGN
ncbi:TIGR02301 family protein [Rhizobium miluonense]|uniref:TIGR02301 family protein n=2 Tax=Rhizobium/Agrobacterium group TaxID=227290 RepID=A0A1C3W124_9HYPH|nr:TIGR02301 family protein [Rhizobium miluonense]